MPERTHFIPDEAHTPSREHVTTHPIVEISNLSISYGPKKAVNNVNLDIAQGKITALIGPSGCGKSTLLRSINRMNDLIPGSRTEGEVWYRGQNLYDQRVDPVEVRRRIGMVFQKANPFPKSIFDNVAYGPRLLGVKDKKLLKEIVQRSLEKAYLWDEVKSDLKKNGLSLSGGQQQRLCIARTLAVEPDVILMDEPCSALDPIATKAIEELMLDLVKNYGTSIVIVTHNMQQAQRVSDYTGFLNIRKDEEINGKENRWGELVEFAPTEQLFAQPSQEETSQYINGEFG